mgnify:CR=1 FL=1
MPSLHRQSRSAQQSGSPKGIILRIHKTHRGHFSRLYADEGISGTKIKNRKGFLRMMSDAEHGLLPFVLNPMD